VDDDGQDEVLFFCPGSWDEMSGSVDDDVASLFKELRQVAMAAAQIAHVGTAQQIAEAGAALATVRRTLYSLLAQDGSEH
jgi:hypothetical protein